jgi:hypothetical protein
MKSSTFEPGLIGAELYIYYADYATLNRLHKARNINLTLFVPGVFHVSMTAGALIGRTLQKFCLLIAIILLVLLLVSFIFL